MDQLGRLAHGYPQSSQIARDDQMVSVENIFFVVNLARRVEE
jgi:hypothetical protein